MAAFAEWMSGLSVLAKDIGVVLGIMAPPAMLVWRYVVHPRVIVPCNQFLRQAAQDSLTINRIAPKVDEMSQALGPNGGKSLHDQINQTAARVTLMFDATPWPTFEADASGNNTRVNHQFERAFGYSGDDMRGHGWKNLIHADDAHGYFQAWESAVRDTRSFFYQCKMVTKDRVVMHVIVTAAPSDNKGLVLWMGTVKINQIDTRAQVRS